MVDLANWRALSRVTSGNQESWRAGLKSRFPLVAVNDREVAAAVAFAFAELKLVVEPGGAVALAALMTGKIDVKDKVGVAVLSGGNVDPEVFSKLVA